MNLWGPCLFGRISPLTGTAFWHGPMGLNIPVTVHVAMGTDIIHFHPSADGASIGRASHNDFRIFSSLVSELEGGVFINLGSAVIMPEVFFKGPESCEESRSMRSRILRRSIWTLFNIIVP